MDMLREGTKIPATQRRPAAADAGASGLLDIFFAVPRNGRRRRPTTPATRRCADQEIKKMAREQSVAPKERVNITYRPATGDAVRIFKSSRAENAKSAPV